MYQIIKAATEPSKCPYADAVAKSATRVQGAVLSNPMRGARTVDQTNFFEVFAAEPEPSTRGKRPGKWLGS